MDNGRFIIKNLYDVSVDNVGDKQIEQTKHPFYVLFVTAKTKHPIIWGKPNTVAINFVTAKSNTPFIDNIYLFMPRNDFHESNLFI